MTQQQVMVMVVAAEVWNPKPKKEVYGAKQRERERESTKIKVHTNYTIMVPLMGKAASIDSFCLKIKQSPICLLE